MATNLKFSPEVEASKDSTSTLVVGHKATLEQANLKGLLPEAAATWLPTLLDSLKPGDSSDSTQTWLQGDEPHKC